VHRLVLPSSHVLPVKPNYVHPPLARAMCSGLLLHQGPHVNSNICMTPGGPISYLPELPWWSRTPRQLPRRWGPR
jgi:hypothetical protein